MGDNNIESKRIALGGIFLIIGWLLAIALVAYLVHLSMYSTKSASILETQTETQVTLYRDYDSHFRVTGSINGIEVTFLVDTGATTVAIPEKIAKRANLKKIAEVFSQTANGEAMGYATNINDLAIGPIQLHDISAIIMPGMGSEEILLGMNVLSKFRIQQDNSTLTLTYPVSPGLQRN